MYNSFDDTILHRNKVAGYISKITSYLTSRGLVHDHTKLISPEKEYFDEYTPKLKNVTYGSDEYKEFLKKMNPALIHHYSNNLHHPECHENGISGMTLVDICEMLCDWKAASERHENGDIFKSIEINQDRFGYNDDLKQIFINTAKLLLKRDCSWM